MPTRVSNNNKQSSKRQKLIEQIDIGLAEDRADKIVIFLKILEDIYNFPNEDRDVKKQRYAIRNALRHHSLGFLDLENITPGMVDALIDKLSEKAAPFGVDPIKELLKAVVNTINTLYKKLNPDDARRLLLRESNIMLMYGVELDDDIKTPFFRKAVTKSVLMDIEMHKYNKKLIKKRMIELAKQNELEEEQRQKKEKELEGMLHSSNSDASGGHIKEEESKPDDEEFIEKVTKAFISISGTKEDLLSLDPIENMVRYYKALLDKTSSRKLGFAIDQLQGAMLLNIIRYSHDGDNRNSREKIVRCITSYFCILQAKVITKLICEGKGLKAQWFIIKNQFDVTSSSEPLKAAIKQNNVEMVRFLLNHGAAISKWDLQDPVVASDEIMRLLKTSFPNAFVFDYTSDLFSMPRKAMDAQANVKSLRDGPRDKITRYIWANTILQNNINEFSAQYLSMLWYQFASSGEDISKLCRVNVAQSPESLRSVEYTVMGRVEYNIPYDGDRIAYLKNLLSQYTHSKHQNLLGLQISVVKDANLLDTYLVRLSSSKPEIQSLIECLESRENKLSQLKIKFSDLLSDGEIQPFYDETHIHMKRM